MQDYGRRGIADWAYELLPPTLREIAEVAGMDAALRIAEHYGGVRLDMPARQGARHRLASLVGEEAASRLAAHYHGEEIQVPRAARAARALYYQSIAERYQAGASAARLAREHGCTERWIYQVVRRQRESLAATQQQDLL